MPPAPLATITSSQRWAWPPRSDPRWPFAALLTLYCLLGFTVLGFNRSPWQMVLTVGAGALLDMGLALVVRRQRIIPLSAWISGCSLAILLNYSHASPVVLVPVLLAIGSKYVVTLEGRHFINPSLFGVAVSLLASRELITAAPAYQWAGSSLMMSAFVIAAAVLMFLMRVGRGVLVVSFLIFYAAQTALRAFIMRHHLPPEMLFIGTMTTPPFFLFTFYMLTDPATSPKRPRDQVLVALAIALVDLVLHVVESVYTFFYAAFAVASARYVYFQVRSLWARGWLRWVQLELNATRRRAVLAVGLVGVGYAGFVWAVDGPQRQVDPGFRMERVDVDAAGLGVEMGTLLNELDPRVAHVAKWILSVGDAVGVGDYDNDGDVDLFLTNLLKRPEDRAALYRNDGEFRFVRVPLPAIAGLVANPVDEGLVSGATFVDYDNDGDQDLALAVSSGRSRLLKNLLTETGTPEFLDASIAAGLNAHTASPAITFLDLENDGDLDMLILNAPDPFLNAYDPPRKGNIFKLPPPEYPGDRRMFRFMHNGWHDADNGGLNLFFENNGDGTFRQRDSAELGMSETRWSLAVSTVDFNQDGYTDLYIANDFGPDDLLLNERGRRFRHVVGSLYNEVGRDTYKGMNASVADFDRNGFMDVYISNVHHALQAEGSLLWMVSPSDDPSVPRFSDEATQRGALNERRFGWGAQAGDINNDGWADIIQANGMVDDRFDRLYDGRKDYFYVNHKLMQSGPDIHTYADMWGDIRGRVIYPNEPRRAYLNLGDEAPGHFVDVARTLGMADPENSRGVLLSDLDNDGDLDLLVTNQHAGTDVYRSTLRQVRSEDANFIAIQLVGTGPTTSRQAAGSVVRVSLEQDGQRVTMMDEVGLLGGFSSQKDPRLHFGLGRYRGPVDVEVRWHGGGTERFQLQPNRVHVLRQGS